MKVSDAELEAMAAPRGRYGSIVRGMAREMLDLRARVVGGADGPDQGEADAWGALHEDGSIDATTTTASHAALWARTRTVVPLYRDRAPGAVAAAPEPVAWALVGPGVAPDDYGMLPAYVSHEAADAHAGGDIVVKPLYGDPPGAVAAAPPGDERGRVLDEAAAEVVRHLTSQGWRLTPPAGHEDEAAVERRGEDRT